MDFAIRFRGRDHPFRSLHWKRSNDGGIRDPMPPESLIQCIPESVIFCSGFRNTPPPWVFLLVTFVELCLDMPCLVRYPKPDEVGRNRPSRRLISMDSDKKDNLKQYAEYNKLLRTWFVGFGIAVPIFFFSNGHIYCLWRHSLHSECMAKLFLFGVAFQVLSSFINKIVTWSAYRTHGSDLSKLWCPTKICAKAENWFLIDVILDLGTFVTFGWGLYLAVNMVTSKI